MNEQVESLFRDLAGATTGVKGHEGDELADLCAEAILALNAGYSPDEKEVVHRLLDLTQQAVSEKLRTVCIGTVWREDVKWLDLKDIEGIEAREKVLLRITTDKPEALSAAFWRAVADRGPKYVKIAFEATSKIHPEEASRLLVKLGQAALLDRINIDIRSTVDGFLADKDSSVRSAFLDAVRRLTQIEKRKFMTHLDMSLLAELDESAIEHRGKGFYYDEDAERKKREDKGKDIFSEVARRLGKGEKPN
jgi:hypothetical protein